MQIKLNACIRAHVININIFSIAEQHRRRIMVCTNSRTSGLQKKNRTSQKAHNDLYNFVCGHVGYYGVLPNQAGSEYQTDKGKEGGFFMSG